TASTKSRGEVRGGGRKPWRQKGTGRARHGSIRSPIWRGGAITFGPKPRDYTINIPKKIRNLALKSALTAKVAAGELIVVEELNFDVPRTRKMVGILENLKVGGKALIVTGGPNAMVAKSARNIPGVKSLPATALNVYDLLLHGQLILTEGAVAKVEEVLG
ncbi:MAG: 50S ribosomal protein L4, partial [Firmicutes bacterium]|nr:50S ribosomal protein L4 [Bacillota bacterium]